MGVSVSWGEGCDFSRGAVADYWGVGTCGAGMPRGRRAGTRTGTVTKRWLRESEHCI